MSGGEGWEDSREAECSWLQGFRGREDALLSCLRLEGLLPKIPESPKTQSKGGDTSTWEEGNGHPLAVHPEEDDGKQRPEGDLLWKQK